MSEYSFKRAIAIVPARGGSKRVPRKNLRELNGKPLVCYTLDAAVESHCFTDIFLSSDSDEILALSDIYENVQAAPRSAEWAGDKVTIFDFIAHFITENAVIDSYDAIALLLPTAPFRSVDCIRSTAYLLNKKVDAAITLTRYSFPPQFSVYLDNETSEVKPVFDPSPLIMGTTRSQDQAPILHPNGAMFIAWVTSYIRHGSFYNGHCLGYEMSEHESIDIDTESDFEYAEFMMQRHHNNN